MERDELTAALIHRICEPQSDALIRDCTAACLGRMNAPEDAHYSPADGRTVVGISHRYARHDVPVRVRELEPAA